jgi:hypothetical protein
MCIPIEPMAGKLRGRAGFDKSYKKRIIDNSRNIIGVK